MEKLRSRSQKERERIAVLATGVSFAIIFVIWLISFSEMNKDAPTESGTSTVGQLKDLKDGAVESKKSIEEMWNQLPSEEDLNGAVQSPVSGEANPENTSSENGQGVPTATDDGQSDQIPPLP
jgi:hypothetical protein